ncbi:alpha/beta fold hydrolase [Marinobacteraceae bacterium S3BR75-40.1]
MNAADLREGENREVPIPVEHDQIYGDLTLVPASTGLVLFAHGSGSSRHSSRNRRVAQVLNRAGISTLLFDLLTAQEDETDILTREFRFDIALLAKRLGLATDWVQAQPPLADQSVGYFGASTGAAAALTEAARRPDRIHAVVSRGGRADMADEALERVQAPTLLIVGGRDDVVIDLNRQALGQLHCTCKLEIVEGATHLFEEPGALEQVADLAKDWFLRYLA